MGLLQTPGGPPAPHGVGANIEALGLGLKMSKRNLMPGNLLMALTLDPLLMLLKTSSGRVQNQMKLSTSEHEAMHFALKADIETQRGLSALVGCQSPCCSGGMRGS